MSDTKNGSISVGSTIRIKPLQSIQIIVRFRDMEPTELVYEVPNANFGSVTGDGIYTAPEKAGSYEVRIACKNNLQIEAYADISVNK